LRKGAQRKGRQRGAAVAERAAGSGKTGGAGKAGGIDVSGEVSGVDLLTDDHNRMRALFKRFAGADDGREKRKIAEDVFLEIELHTKAEEELFYPALRRRATEEEMKDMLDESLEEHHVADTIVQEMKAMSTGDRRFDAKMTVLRENIEHHAGEEEEDMFPKARKILGETDVELGAQMIARKAQLVPPQRPDQ
jgi:hemerythrin superfamily protein